MQLIFIQWNHSCFKFNHHIKPNPNLRPLFFLLLLRLFLFKAFKTFESDANKMHRNPVQPQSVMSWKWKCGKICPSIIHSDVMRAEPTSKYSDNGVQLNEKNQYFLINQFSFFKSVFEAALDFHWWLIVLYWGL